MRNWLHDVVYFAPTPKLGGGWICHKDSPSPPPAPDYAGAAQAQGAANVETARTQGRMNNPNIYTPYGSQTVTWGNYDNEQPTIVQTLAPAQQALLDSQNRISNNLAGVAEAGINRVGQGMATPFNTGALPNMQTNVQGGNLQNRLDFSGAPALPGIDDFSADRDAVTNAMLARSEPQFQRDEELTRTRLMNQGLAAGSEASNYDLDTLNRARNDARNQAILAGGQEQSRLFNLASQARNQYTGEQAQQGNFANQVAQQQFQQGLANANLANQGRQTSIQEQAYLRQLPLNELNALRTGAQVQNPQFQQFNPTAIGQTPIFGATQAQGAYDQNMYNTQQGAVNAFNSGLANIAGRAAGAYFGGF